MKKLFNLVWGISIAALSVVSFTFAYTQEEQEAYEWAYKYGITTQSTIDAANLDGNITRQAFSKMVINFLEKAIWIEESTLKSCSFPDENKITTDLVPYTKKTCAYGIMWKDGTKFNPTQSLDKAQLWTVLSRIIWRDEYNNNWKLYYIYHLNMLKTNWIMDNIDNPTETYVKRWDVLIMLKRINDKFNSNTDINDTNTWLENEDIILDWEKIVYYDNGKIAVKMNFKNWKKDWIWESYYENGQLQKRNIFKDEKLDWEQIYYYENGQLMGKDNYKNGELDWESIAYHENGKLKAKWNYKKWNLDWETFAYYENGQLMGKNNYKNWEYDWERLFYHENGQLWGKWNFNNWNPDWKIVSYYENGQVYTIWNYKNWIENGEFISYYENGQLMGKDNYKNGELDWESIAYHENGKLKAKWNYKKWNLDWEVIVYYENGQLEKKWFVNNGKEYWEWIHYYKNGQLMEKDNYKDGKFDWEFIIYHENGKLKSKWKFKDWAPDWEIVSYYENEQLIWKFYYKNWKLDWNFIVYYDNGKIRSNENYKDWKLDWILTWYYKDWSIRLSHNFTNWKWTKSYFNKNWTLIWTWEEIYTEELNEIGWTYKSILNWLDISYYDSEQIYKISNYKDWELNWIQTWYYENWKISSICKYNNWIKDWKCLMYDESWNNIKEIEIYYPVNDNNIIGNNVDIVGNCYDLPNSVATIYIDGEEVWTSNVWNEWLISTTIPNIDDWKHTILIEILDASWKIIWKSDEIEFYINNPNLIPDSAEIEVGHDTLIVWESTDLKVTIIKDDSPMKTYRWTIRIIVTDEQWLPLKDSEYSVTNDWIYEFKSSDLWSKYFQRSLEINKTWKFYVEVQDLYEVEDRILWRQAITVIKA